MCETLTQSFWTDSRNFRSRRHCYHRLSDNGINIFELTLLGKALQQDDQWRCFRLVESFGSEELWRFMARVPHAEHLEEQQQIITGNARTID